MIETENLTKIYNRGKPNEVQAIIDANIVAADGEITVFVGPSGCGKTTLMSLIGQLLSPSTGRVLIDGQDISAYSEHWKAVFRRENIGYIFQHINLLPNLNAVDNVLMPLLCHNVDIEKRRGPALVLLNDLGLGDRSYFKVENLSGGEQQRVSVARALIAEPKIIIADEPLTFVDEASAKKITDHLIQLRDEGKTILISTHVSNLARLGDKTISILNGKIQN
ncbi:ABC transporter ATP-binding protein [Candidatus Bathyarchaeota archaeon]|nr:MAG: ABC transporter ATP-binding protein [Candidatus Bathyarchaeota archaeon]